MRKVLVLAVVLALSFLYFQPLLFAQAEGKAKEQGAIVNVNNKICPVMGRPASPEYTAVYKGKRYNFCCPGCPKMFEKDPEKYIAKLGQTEKKGS